MKIELIVAGRAAKQMDFATSPHAGEIIFLEGERISVKEVVHDVARRKLQVVCEEPNPFSAFCHAAEPLAASETDTDIDDNDE